MQVMSSLSKNLMIHPTFPILIVIFYKTENNIILTMLFYLKNLKILH